MVAPLLLDGADLLPMPVHITWTGGEFLKARNWCCKTSATPHGPTVDGVQFTIDLGRLPPTTEKHELYADIFLTSEKYLWGNYALFTVTPAKNEPESPADTAASTATLTWTVPTQRENGKALAPEELWGYVVMTRHDGGDIVTHGVKGAAVTEYTLDDLDPGEWAFAVKALDTDELQSKPSEWVTLTIQAPLE